MNVYIDRHEQVWARFNDTAYMIGKLVPTITLPYGAHSTAAAIQDLARRIVYDRIVAGAEPMHD